MLWIIELLDYPSIVLLYIYRGVLFVFGDFKYTTVVQKKKDYNKQTLKKKIMHDLVDNSTISMIICKNSFTSFKKSKKST